MRLKEKTVRFNGISMKVFEVVGKPKFKGIKEIARDIARREKKLVKA